MPTSDSDVFEVTGPARPARRPCLQDVVYVEVSDDSSSDDVVAVPTAEVRRQVFYYSAKMYQYLCENGTPERIAQAAMRKVDDRQGVLKKRKESQCRTEKLREYAKEHNIDKPAGSELARLRRNRAATVKNTAQVMGRNADQIKRRRYNQEQSDFSQSSQQEQPVLASQDQQPCSQNQGRKRVRHLYASTAIPSFTSELEAAEDSRTSDAQLKSFYDFLLPYLSRAPSLRATVRNCCWRTCEDARYLSAHPNVIMFDTTCKTNIKNKHFGYGSGLTTNRNWFKGWSFMLESLQKRDFSWLWNTALPVIIPASVRARLLVVVTDGDQNMIDAISSAFSLGRNGQFLWGTQDKPVLLRRCIFHLLHLNFEKEYANFKTDGGVGIKVRDWLKQAARRSLTKAQLLSAIDKILEWVQTVANDFFTDAARECLLEWVRARSRHIQDWARYPFNSCRSFDYETTSPAEGAHSGLKMSNEVRL
jgi:hypothetical protein